MTILITSIIIGFAALLLWAGIVYAFTRMFAAQVSKPEPPKPYGFDSFDKSGPWRDG